MRVLSFIVFVLAVASVGCGSSVLLRVYTVTEGPPTRISPGGTEPDIKGMVAVGGVKFFFYPFVRDSVIHQVPEREFITDRSGRAEYIESVSPLGDKMGALVAMKPGYMVDTVLFPFDIGDTVNIVVRMQLKQQWR